MSRTDRDGDPDADRTGDQTPERDVPLPLGGRGRDGAVASGADLAQLLTGLGLHDGPDDGACDDCGTTLRPGDVVAVAAGKPVGERTWRVRRVRCHQCARVALDAPGAGQSSRGATTARHEDQAADVLDAAFGRADALVAATVAEVMDAARQSGRPVARDVTVLASSPPTEGSP